MSDVPPSGWRRAPDGRWSPPNNGKEYGIPPLSPTSVTPTSGSELLRITWSTIVSDPKLLVCAALGMVSSLALSFGLLVAMLGHLPGLNDFRFPHYLIVLPALIVGAFPATYANSIVLVAADQRMRGDHDAGLMQAVTRVNRRVPALIAWSLLTGVVGAILQVLEERLKIGGRIVAWLIGLSWAVATLFVVPCIVFEDVGVVKAIPRSARIFKEKWGLNVRARVLTAGLAFGVSFAIGIVAVIVASISVAAGVALGITLLLAFSIFVGTLQSVLTAALYRYTVDGALVGGYTEAHFAAAFRQRR